MKLNVNAFLNKYNDVKFTILKIDNIHCLKTYRIPKKLLTKVEYIVDEGIFIEMEFLFKFDKIMLIRIMHLTPDCDLDDHFILDKDFKLTNYIKYFSLIKFPYVKQYDGYYKINKNVFSNNNDFLYKEAKIK